MAVYPRVCGGTWEHRIVSVHYKGLSPRVRGNHNAMVEAGMLWGSIPACAGEPRSTTPRVGRFTVYPRVCGGTYNLDDISDVVGGLSPRVRGNPSK